MLACARKHVARAMRDCPGAVAVFLFTDNADDTLSCGADKEERVVLPDPTVAHPWGASEVQRFAEAAQAAAEASVAGDFVLCVCTGGVNRSRALARAAGLLAGWPHASILRFVPSDQELLDLADAVGSHGDVSSVRIPATGVRRSRRAAAPHV